jgi:hypothetical protein
MSAGCFCEFASTGEMASANCEVLIYTIVGDAH